MSACVKDVDEDVDDEVTVTLLELLLFDDSQAATATKSNSNRTTNQKERTPRRMHCGGCRILLLLLLPLGGVVVGVVNGGSIRVIAVRVGDCACGVVFRARAVRQCIVNGSIAVTELLLLLVVVVVVVVVDATAWTTAHTWGWFAKIGSCANTNESAMRFCSIVDWSSVFENVLLLSLEDIYKFATVIFEFYERTSPGYRSLVSRTRKIGRPRPHCHSFGNKTATASSLSSPPPTSLPSLAPKSLPAKCSKPTALGSICFSPRHAAEFFIPQCHNSHTLGAASAQ
jgi:hypothetical protein